MTIRDVLLTKSSRFRPKRRLGTAHNRRRTYEVLESRLVLASETVFYDYVEDGVLKGGHIEMEVDLGPALALPEAAPWDSTTVVNNGPTANRVDLVFVGDGYTNAQLGDYATHVNNVVPTFFAESPLDAYSTFFNVHRVDVISNESGVDNDPTNGISRDTALDMGYFCSGIERLLCVDVGKALAAAGDAPDVDQVLAVANSSKYGGAGYGSSNLGTLAGDNAGAVEIALHEFGHSFADLADEYDTGGPTTYTGPEPAAPNVSIHDAANMSSLETKWHLWLDEANVDTFEGAMYSKNGIYRPTDDSKMRSLDRPFEQVNTEQFVLSAYETVRPIDSATPPGTYPPDTEFFVDPVDPTTHNLDVQWFLDGVPIPGANGTSFDTSTLGLLFGTYSLSAKVVDNTDLVRDEALRDSLMTEERQWTIEVNSPPIITNVQLSASEINESGSVTITVDFVDPDVGDQITLAADLGFGAGLQVIGVYEGGQPQSVSFVAGYDDDHPKTDTPSDVFDISLVVTDSYGLSDSAAAQLTVNNVDPVIVDFTSDATFEDKAEEDDTVSILANFTDVGILDTHTAEVDWGDGTMEAAFVTPGQPGAGTVTGDHMYSDGGIYTITITLIDDDTGTTTAETTAVVTGVGVNNGILYIIGSSEDDEVSLNRTGKSTLKVKATFVTEDFRSFEEDDVQEIISYLCEGEDDLTISNRVTIPAIIHGGADDDHLNAGGGPTVLLGGGGNDELVGQGGRNILIGGIGLDQLTGGKKGDVLIGGTTDADDNDAVLMALANAWDTAPSYTAGVAAIDAALAVTDDDDSDKLTGSSSQDLFYDGIDDNLTDVKLNEDILPSL